MIGFEATAYVVTESNAMNPVTLIACVRTLDRSIAMGHSVVVLLQSIDETATGNLVCCTKDCYASIGFHANQDPKIMNPLLKMLH